MKGVSCHRRWRKHTRLNGDDTIERKQKKKHVGLQYHSDPALAYPFVALPLPSGETNERTVLLYGPNNNRDFLLTLSESVCITHDQKKGLGKVEVATHVGVPSEKQNISGTYVLKEIMVSTLFIFLNRDARGAASTTRPASSSASKLMHQTRAHKGRNRNSNVEKAAAARVTPGGATTTTRP